jgi:signal peptidase II
MSTKKGKRRIKFFLIFLILIFLDQITKFLILENLFFGKSQKIFENFLYFTLVKNTGAAFGILSGFNFLFIFLTFLFILFVISIYKNLKYLNDFVKYGILLQFSGAISNLIDRIRLGYVIDFIDLKFWPVFNLADIFITIGTFFIIAGIIKN